MGQLVDQGDGRVTSEDGVEIHLFDDNAMVFDAPPPHLLQSLDKGRRLGTAVCLDKADHHVDSLCLQAVCLLQHLVGLADASGKAKVDLEPAALLLADQVQEVFRRRSVACAAHCPSPEELTT